MRGREVVSTSRSKGAAPPITPIRPHQKRTRRTMTMQASRNTILQGAQATQEEVIDRTKDIIDGVQRDAAAVSKVVQRSAADIAAEVTKKLREAGVDTDQIIVTAREQADQVQKRITDEIRDRPLRALGFAALAGVVLGLVTSR